MRKGCSVTDEIHLNPETLEQYFRAGVPAVIAISTRVDAKLEIDPHSELLRLVLPAQGATPDVTAFERLSVDRRIAAGRGELFEFTVDATDIHYEAYSFLEAILDYVRSGASFRKAVSDALSGQADLLSKRKKLTDERVAGLWGELDMLEHLIPRLGELIAMQAWLGPLAQEHDFGFELFEAEVKTTTGSARRHVIGSATQLQATPGRPLLLVSVQLALGGAAEGAVSLPQKINRVRNMLEKTRRTFDTHLTGLGYHADDADLYTATLQSRSVPRAYVVDDDFPAITQPRLNGVVPQPGLVSDVSYRVDVSGLDFVRAPFPLDTYTEDPAANV